MTEEQIKKNAEAYAIKICEETPIDYRVVSDAYFAGAHSRDEEICRMNTTIRLYANQIAQLRKEIEQLHDPWISVEERMPEDDKDVFVREVFTSGIFHLVGKVLNGGKWYCYGFGWQDNEKITHWMPIPKL